MAAFREQAERFGTRDRRRRHRPGRLLGAAVPALGARRRIPAEAVIVATGASALWLGLESETRLRGRGVSACATCDGFFFRDREIAVVGGGDTAFEEATFLTRFATKVHLLHRRDAFRASKIMVDRAKAHPKIEIHTNTAVDEVLGDAKVEGPAPARHRMTTSADVRLPTRLFIAIGYRPNTEAFRDWLEVDDKGYLVVHDETGSKIEGVFVAGDVHDHRYRQAVTAAGDGCKAAIDAERWLEIAGHHRSGDVHRLVARRRAPPNHPMPRQHPRCRSPGSFRAARLARRCLNSPARVRAAVDSAAIIADHGGCPSRRGRRSRPAANHRPGSIAVRGRRRRSRRQRAPPTATSSPRPASAPATRTSSPRSVELAVEHYLRRPRRAHAWLAGSPQGPPRHHGHRQPAAHPLRRRLTSRLPRGNAASPSWRQRRPA